MQWLIVQTVGIDAPGALMCVLIVILILECGVLLDQKKEALYSKDSEKSKMKREE